MLVRVQVPLSAPFSTVLCSVQSEKPRNTGLIALASFNSVSGFTGSRGNLGVTLGVQASKYGGNSGIQ